MTGSLLPNGARRRVTVVTERRSPAMARLRLALAAGLRPRGRGVFRATAGVLLLSVVMGCGDAAKKTGASSARASDAGEPVAKAAADGPVRITLLASAGEVAVSMPVTVSIEVLVEKGVSLELDDYLDALNEGEHRFELRVLASRRPPAQVLANGGSRLAQEHDVEFIVPGEFELPPVKIKYAMPESSDASATAGVPDVVQPLPGPRELATEPLVLRVVDPSGVEPTPEELQTPPALSPIELADEWRVWRPVIAMVVAGVVTAMVAWLLRRRSRRAALEVVVPAHEWARDQIAKLLAEDLITRGLVQDFYYRISGILRGYIERRFRVSAPEMTTEEFLHTAARDGRFGETDQRELVDFLTACDVVKYARHEPSSAETNAVVSTAGGYVERTRERLLPTAGELHGDTSARERAA